MVIIDDIVREGVVANGWHEQTLRNSADRIDKALDESCEIFCTNTECQSRCLCEEVEEIREMGFINEAHYKND